MADIDPDTFADKILARLGKRRPVTDDDEDDDAGNGPPAKVPYHRFAEGRRELKDMRKQLDEMAEEVKTYKAAAEQRQAKLAADAEKAIQKAREEAAASVQAIAKGHAEDLELVDHGLRDPLGRKAARDAWSMLPDAGRPASVAEYVKSIRAGIEARNAALADAKADPSKAPALPEIPATMRAYFEPLIKAPPEKKAGAKPPSVDDGTATPRDVGDILAKRPSKDYHMQDWLSELQQAERAGRG